MLKKVFLLALVLLVVFSVCVPIGLAEDDIEFHQQRYTYILYADNDLSISGAGLAAMWSEIITYDNGPDNVAMSTYLQRYINESWQTVNHWRSSADGLYDWWVGYWYVTIGYYYRLKTYFYAKQGDMVLESTVRYKYYYH